MIKRGRKSTLVFSQTTCIYHKIFVPLHGFLLTNTYRMKKIIFLIVSIFMVHMLSATPRTVATQHNNTNIMEKIHLLTNRLDQKQVDKAPTIAAHNAQTQNEEIVLEFTDFSKEPKYYSSGDWYVVLENEDDWEVYLNWKAPKSNYCGTFYTKDFLHDYSYIFTPDNRQNGGIHYKDITMTISIVEVNPALDHIVLDATIKGTDGNTYIIHATHEIIKAKEIVTQSIMDATLTPEMGYYTIAGKNEDLDIRIAVLSENITGIYPTLDEFDLSNSHIIYKGQNITPIRMEAIVDLGNLESGVLAYGAQFSILSADTVIYNIFMAAPFPEPKDTIDIVCQNMRFDDRFASVYNIITITALNEKYKIQILYNDEAIGEGDYTQTNATVYITNLDTYEEVESLVTQMSIRQDLSSNSYIVEAVARCTDNIVYQLSLSWIEPVATDTIPLYFEQSAKASYYQQDNDLLLINENDNYSLSLNIAGVEMGEKFTLENVVAYYSSLTNEETGTEIDIAKVDGTIYQSADTTWIKADVVGFDAICYQVALWYAAPTPTDTVTLHINDVPFENHLEEGYFQFIEYSEDFTHMISFTVASHEVIGTFCNDGMFGKFGTGKYDFFNDYTYISVWNNQTNEYDIYTIEKGELVVSMAIDGTIYAEANVICENAILYHISFTSKYARPHLPGDAEEEAVERTYTTDDHITISDYTQTNGLIIFEAESTTHNDAVALYIFANNFDAEIGIPEGTYPINSSLQAGSVLASTGINPDDNSVAPSLYYTFSGDYIDTLYFFVEGNVTVTRNKAGKLHLEVNALNSYNIPIHIVYEEDPTETDIENVIVDTNASKIVKDGQLFIMKEGIMYNVLGTVVK